MRGRLRGLEIERKAQGHRPREAFDLPLVLGLNGVRHVRMPVRFNLGSSTTHPSLLKSNQDVPRASAIRTCCPFGVPLTAGATAARTDTLVSETGAAAPFSLAVPDAQVETRHTEFMFQAVARTRREFFPRLLRVTSAPMWSITTDGRSGNFATNSSFPPMLST